MDSDLLDVLEDPPVKKATDEEKPKGTFVFGRTKTPELRSSRSLTMITAKGADNETSLLQESVIQNNKKSLLKATQSTKFDSVLREASKKIAKETQETNYLSKNKEVLGQASKRSISKSIDKPIAKLKQFESVPPKLAQKKSTKTLSPNENKENELVTKKSTPLSEKSIISVSQNKNNIQPEKEIKEKQKGNSIQPPPDKKQKASVSPVPKKAKETEYASKAEVKTKPDVPRPEVVVQSKSPLPKPELLESKPSSKNEKSQNSAKKETSKSRTKKSYKPETMDLYNRLNEYTKFKENVEKLSQPCQPEPSFESVTPKQAKQAKGNQKAEEFLIKQINNFKENVSPSKDKKRTPQKSIDLQKASQPRFKKQPTHIPNECSFQPMLSKKSLAIVQKMVKQAHPGL